MDDFDLFARGVVRDPCFLAYVAAQEEQARGGLPVKITTPALAIGERLAATISVMRNSDLQLPEHDGRVRPAMVRLHLANRMMKAQLYLWRDDVIGALQSAPPHPPCEVHRPLFPFPQTFHTVESARTTGEADVFFDYQLIDEDNHPDELLFFSWVNKWKSGSGGTESSRVVLGSVRWDSRFPDPRFADEANGSVGGVLKAAAFLRSKYVELKKEKIPRAFKRTLARAGVPSASLDESYISVVTLRYSTHAKAQEDGDGSRRFVHRWWVAGHFRKQWHPSTRRHEFAWIAPYVKGPKDAPFVRRVYSVER